MTAETIFIFTISLILLWIKPGPGQALKITVTLNSGFLNGFCVSLGVITGCVTFFLVAALGTHVLTNFFNDISFYLKTIGGIYLLYLGIKGLNNIKKGVWKGTVETSSPRTLVKNYSLGLLANLANPLPIFFFLGLIPTLVPIGSFSFNDIVIGAVIIMAVGFTVDGLLLLLVNLTKGLLSETKFVKFINIFTSLGFSLIGAFLIYSAFFHGSFSFDI